MSISASNQFCTQNGIKCDRLRTTGQLSVNKNIKPVTIFAFKMALNVTETYNSELEDIRSSLNSAFLILMGIIVFLMQGGFAFLEAGSVR